VDGLPFLRLNFPSFFQHYIEHYTGVEQHTFEHTLGLRAADLLCLTRIKNLVYRLLDKFIFCCNDLDLLIFRNHFTVSFLGGY